MAACLALAVVSSIGCSSTRQKLAQCQRDGEQWRAQANEQQKVIENLHVQNRALADRLAESEKLLARIHEQTRGGIGAIVPNATFPNASSPGALGGENSASGVTAQRDSGWKPSSRVD